MKRARDDGDVDVRCGKDVILVDVIMAVHNAEETVEESVRSALTQTVPAHLANGVLRDNVLDVAVCCFDDGSTDESLSVLKRIASELESANNDDDDAADGTMRTRLLIGSGAVSRGAGHARNRAVSLRECAGANGGVVSTTKTLRSNDRDDATARNDDDRRRRRRRFLCVLDSDDVMRSTRIAEQVSYFLRLPSNEERDRTLLGTTFVREPPGSAWHYSAWANGLTDERLLLERYREVTVLQPTWMMTRARFRRLGGYVESGDARPTRSEEDPDRYELVHPTHDDARTLRLAEDLRLYHAHLYHGGTLRLVRGADPRGPLTVYRHRRNTSQSSSTSRRLLLRLRALAFQRAVLEPDASWRRFAIWGAGRDGKDFFKALDAEFRDRVSCFVDVDAKKIRGVGRYVNKELRANVPVLHFSELARDPAVRASWKEKEENNDASGETRKPFGNIAKGLGDGGDATTVTNERAIRDAEENLRSQIKRHDALTRARRSNGVETLQHSRPTDVGSSDEKPSRDVSLSSVPVVVCVAMYRTNGVLEENVRSIGRTEGLDLWHFS